MLIQDNNSLRQFLPNILSDVDNEQSLFAKMQPFLESAEQWLTDNFLSEIVRDELATYTDFPLRTMAMKAIAYEAFRQALPHLDLILTPNGFGIVSNANIAPASKERVERLAIQLTDNRDDILMQLLRAITNVPAWLDSQQCQFFRATMFPNIDVALRFQKKDGGRWLQYLSIREALLPVEDFFANNYLSTEQLNVFREETQKHLFLTAQHKYICHLLQAIEVRILKSSDPLSAMYFEHTTLTDIVDIIRKNATDYPQWHTSTVKNLYNPPIFQNKSEKGGYWL